MRMWMVDPAVLCRKHLLGEHVECHMFVGALRKGKSVAGYLAPTVMLAANQLAARHDALAAEMLRRGYQHHSPLEQPDVSTLSPTQRQARVDTENSLLELRNRCNECRVKQEGVTCQIM